MNTIVAVYSDWGIGSGGTQPIVLAADRRHFAQLTRGAAVIVGRKTLEDFPGGGPLGGRENIVISRADIRIDGALVVHSPEEAVRAAAKYDNVFVLGGASIFIQMLPHTDRIFVTKIDLAPHSDSFFPNLDRNVDWRCTDGGEALEEDGVGYRFCVYERV